MARHGAEAHGHCSEELDATSRPGDKVAAEPWGKVPALPGQPQFCFLVLFKNLGKPLSLPQDSFVLSPGEKAYLAAKAVLQPLMLSLPIKIIWGPRAQLVITSPLLARRAASL